MDESATNLDLTGPTWVARQLRTFRLFSSTLGLHGQLGWVDKVIGGEAGISRRFHGLSRVEGEGISSGPSMDGYRSMRHGG